MSHVTGIASGNGMLSDGRYSGISPQSNIISLKILDHKGQGSSRQAISALRWIMDNATKYNIKVVNLSIGSNDKHVNQPLQESVEMLWKRGITVVAAAGNPDANDTPPPPISPHVITVGAWEDRQFFTKPRSFPLFSKDSTFQPDIWAPGDNIVSTLSPDYDFSLPNRTRSKVVDTYYIKMSGASMATPLISGAAALLLEKNPKQTPAQIKKTLVHMLQENGGLLDKSSCLSQIGKVVLA